MLAPLKNRAILERAPASEDDNLPPLIGSDACRQSELEAENAALKSALRQARQTQRRSATINAKKSVAQANEILRLEEICRQLQQRIQKFESGQIIIELGQKLMELRDANEQLINAAQRVWYLDKTICAAHRECERLARERDQLAVRLCQHATDMLN